MGEIFVDLRQAGTVLALIVVSLFLWVTITTLHDIRNGRPDHLRLWRRLHFAAGVGLTWLSALGLNGWYAAYFMIGKPAWMIGGHPFVVACVVLGMLAAIIHIRVATYERWGEGPWIATSIAVGIAAWLV
jgi:hypothetical protein